MSEPNHVIRIVTSRGTPSYQLGHYEMTGESGKRRSVFKVDVHLGEYSMPEVALAEWPDEIERLRSIGRESKAEKMEQKLLRLRKLMEGGINYP
jgi:hypothetical protein